MILYVVIFCMVYRGVSTTEAMLYKRCPHYDTLV